MVRIAADYSQWMAGNDLPKLFVNAEPGAILIGALAGFLPKLEQPDRGDRPGLALHSGGFRAGDPPGGGQLDEGELAVERFRAKACPLSGSLPGLIREPAPDLIRGGYRFALGKRVKTNNQSEIAAAPV